MNQGAEGLAESGTQTSEHDIFRCDVSDAALEIAGCAGVPGAAMSFPNAPTVSILVVCCSFEGS